MLCLVRRSAIARCSGPCGPCMCTLPHFPPVALLRIPHLQCSIRVSDGPLRLCGRQNAPSASACFAVARAVARC